MPKNNKAVPPQQSSLKEMWGRKKKLKGTAADASSSAKEEHMEVDDIKSETGKNCIILGLG